MDTHCAAVVLQKLAGEREPDDFADLMERFAIIYDALYPPREPSGEG